MSQLLCILLAFSITLNSHVSVWEIVNRAIQQDFSTTNLKRAKLDHRSKFEELMSLRPDSLASQVDKESTADFIYLFEEYDFQKKAYTYHLRSYYLEDTLLGESCVFGRTYYHTPPRIFLINGSHENPQRIQKTYQGEGYYAYGTNVLVLKKLRQQFEKRKIHQVLQPIKPYYDLVCVIRADERKEFDKLTANKVYLPIVRIETLFNVKNQRTTVSFQTPKAIKPEVKTISYGAMLKTCP